MAFDTNNDVDRMSVLIFSGYNQRAVLAFCRFCVSEGIPFFIIAKNDQDPIRLTTYQNKILCVRDGNQLAIEDFHAYKAMLFDRGLTGRVLLLPSTEYLNRYFLQNSDILTLAGFDIPLVNAEIYQLVSDKFSFGRLCERHGLLVPREYSSIDSVEFPFVAKPKRYFNTAGGANVKPLICYTPTDKDFYLQHFGDNEMYFQQFVGGASVYLLYYIDRSGSYSVYSQKNLVQQGEGLSILAAVSSEAHQSPIAEKFARMLIQIGYYGLIMIEVKIQDGEYYMIEANPRLWGPSQLILDAGMDLFHRFALDNGLIENYTAPNYSSGISYFWMGGLYEDSKLGRSLAFHDFSASNLLADFAKFQSSEIYFREDTLEIFKLENKGYA